MKKSNAYIFLGPELGRKQEAIDEIRKKLPGREETTFYAGETPVNQIVSEIQNHSLFAESKLYLVKNADQIKKKEEIELIAGCMKELEADTTLILISEERKLATAIEAAVPDENRQIFYELFESQKNEWVRSFFKKQGFTIDNDGIATVLEMVENNTAALERECSRLVFFLRKPQETGLQTISADDAEKWLSHGREESAFTLFSRIAAGDLAKALESLHTILAAQENAMGVLQGLVWCYKKLRDYHALLETGNVNNFELKKIGLSAPSARDEYAAASRRYNAAAADAMLALTAEYDILLRSGGKPLEAILMDAYLLKIFALTRYSI